MDGNNFIQIITEENAEELEDYIGELPTVAVGLKSNLKSLLSKIEQMLYKAPAFIELVKANIPKELYVAVFTDEQAKEFADGAVKLMAGKDGRLRANLINTKTKKVASQLTLQKESLTPELGDAMTSYALQMQMAQIAAQIQEVQKLVEEIRQGQENDRLALAYSCQQRLLQAMAIKNPTLKMQALLELAASTEDSRNALMLSQEANIQHIAEQPDSIIGKIVKGESPGKISDRMNEIRDSLSAVNMVSLVEALAYNEMGEKEAAVKSLEYYGQYIEKAYLSHKGLVERLDLIDPTPDNYWTKNIPVIKEKIDYLPEIIGGSMLLGGCDDEDE